MAKILNVKIDNYSFSEVMAKITKFLGERKLHQIVTVNPEFVLTAQKDIEFKKIINTCDLSIPDGFGLQIAAKILKEKIGERLTGVDLTWELAKLASESGLSIYLLGGARGVAENTASRLCKIYPKLKIAGTYAGIPDEKGIADRIIRTKPDILLVAFGAPKQEKFIQKLKIENCKLKIAVGVGGTFDYIAGIVPRAPKWLRKFGLEWLYRLFTQPRRFVRIYNAVIKFPVLVLLYKLRKIS